MKFLVVLSDGQTYDLDGSIVRVTDEQMEKIEEGERVNDIVDLNNRSVCIPLNVQTLSTFLGLVPPEAFAE